MVGESLDETSLDETLAAIVRRRDDLETQVLTPLERVQRRDELHALRARAAQFASRADAWSDAELDRRIARLDQLIGDVHHAHFHVGSVGFSSEGAGGLDAHRTVMHNRSIDEQCGLDELVVERMRLVEVRQRRSAD